MKLPPSNRIPLFLSYIQTKTHTHRHRHTLQYGYPTQIQMIPTVGPSFIITHIALGWLPHVHKCDIVVSR